jgi:hypothetical protein
MKTFEEWKKCYGHEIADNLISGRLKRLKSYHGAYVRKTYGEIKQLASAHPPDPKARQMKKLIERQKHLQDKPRRPRS